MTESRRARFDWTPRVQPDPAHLFNPYRMTLAAMTYPAWRHCVLGGVRAGCLALLGHPWLALAWFAVSCAADFGMQIVLARWTRQIEGRSDDSTPVGMALLALARSAVYVSGPLIAALSTGSLADALFLAVMGGFALTPVALSYGAFSPKVFWGFVLPPLVAMAAVAVDQLPLGPALTLASALAASAWVLAVVSLTWRESLGGWRQTHDASRDLIRELESARDAALSQRVAADLAREEARKAGEARAGFLATMSHEIRTPMNGMLGMASALRRSVKDPAQVKQLDTLMQSGEYLLSILNDVLDLSRIDSGRLELLLTPEHLPDFLSEVADFWRPQAAAKGLKLKLVCDASVPAVVNMDSVRLRQVLYNLIGNALKYTDKGTLTLTARAGPERQGRTRVFLTVSDTGRGIPPDVLPTLFERFAAGGDIAEARTYGGTGLGLAISKQMTELMGGRIRAESAPGGGAAFHVELVLETARAAALARVPTPEAPAAGSRSLRVLAVDDDPVNLIVIEQMLAGAGHRPVKAVSGAEALEFAAAEPFDIILMDVHMPDLSGAQALKALRSRPGPNRATPAIAVTADVTFGGQSRHLAHGFSEQVIKPLRAPELLGAIARTVRPAPKKRAKRA